MEDGFCNNETTTDGKAHLIETKKNPRMVRHNLIETKKNPTF